MPSRVIVEKAVVFAAGSERRHRPSLSKFVNRVTVALSDELRRRHHSRAAAISSLQACESVLDAPGATEVPHDPVVHAARAAGDYAHALVAGGPPHALAVFGRGWEGLAP